MAISYISSASDQHDHVAITQPTAGDLILAFAHRDGSTTAPGLISGFTTIASGGANTNSARLMYKFSDGTETDSGSSANATSIAVIVYRGVDPSFPFGIFKVGGAASATLSYTAATPFIADSTSWFAGFAGHRSATNVGQAPTNMTLRTSDVDVAGSDTNGGSADWTVQTVGVDASSGWRTYVVEIKAAPSAPAAIPLVQHVHTGGMEYNAGVSGNAFKVHLPNPSLAGNCLVLGLTWNYDNSDPTITDDQSNTWVTTGPSIDDGVELKSKIFYALNIAANTTVVTITFGSAIAHALQADLTEFYNVKTSAADDGHAHTASGTAPWVQAGSFTPTTNADLIYCYAYCQQSTTTGLISPELTRVEGGPNWAILSADLTLGSCSMAQVQATAAAINPSFQTSGTLVFNTLAQAFLYQSAGNAPPTTGIYVARVFHGSNRAASNSYKTQFASQGNLFAWVTSYPTTEKNMTGITDTSSNTWTEVVATDPAGYPQCFYSKNVTGNDNLILTLASAAGNSMPFVLYDIMRADTSAPYDKSAEATDTQAHANDDITVAPSVTPSNAGSLIIVSMPMGTGPPDNIDAPAGAVFDSIWFTGQDDTSAYFDSADGYVHLYAGASAQSFTWSTANASASGWAAKAYVFKPAASGSTSYPRSVAGSLGGPSGSLIRKFTGKRKDTGILSELGTVLRKITGKRNIGGSL